MEFLSSSQKGKLEDSLPPRPERAASPPTRFRGAGQERKDGDGDPNAPAGPLKVKEGWESKHIEFGTEGMDEVPERDASCLLQVLPS